MKYILMKSHKSVYTRADLKLDRHYVFLITPIIKIKCK